MKKYHKQVRHHAKKHEDAHLNLKNLIKRYNPKRENVGKTFWTTFIVVLLTILIFRNWGNITNTFDGGSGEREAFQTEGFQTGVLGNYRISQQSKSVYRELIAAILTEGSALAAESNMAFGSERTVELPDREKAMTESVWLTNYLSTGQHLTKMEHNRAKSLQKSIISTYYLGEKTIDINNIIELDSKLLSQINNTLSVDLFQYLNQSVNRSDSLDEYLHLLTRLSERARERINDLESKINFLSGNFANLEQQAKISEEIFFNNIQMFNGPNATKELAEFVGVTESQVEIKAKMGAYTTLKGYYQFYKPRLENHINTIRSNRSALIAGVKVVEIQNMTLPLIIRGQ